MFNTPTSGAVLLNKAQSVRHLVVGQPDKGFTLDMVDLGAKGDRYSVAQFRVGTVLVVSRSSGNFIYQLSENVRLHGVLQKLRM